MSHIKVFLNFIFVLTLISCGGAENSEAKQVQLPLPPEPVNVPIEPINDINTKPNEISEAVNENGVEVGITAFAKDVDDTVSYTLLDDANGRFSINPDSGVVTLANFNLIDSSINTKHTINIQATSADSTIQTKSFEINILINYENDYSIVSSFKTLLDWNHGSGRILAGWTWFDNIAYNNPGWLQDINGDLGGQEKFSWGLGARSFNKGDYGKDNTALIDLERTAPSTAGGGSLLVTETDMSTDHRSTWWLWYDGKPLSERGITNSKTDRMDFYLKLQGSNLLNDDGGKESIGNNFHIGTYLCWKTGKPAYGTGDGCPYEGEGNQHYYHYLAVNPNAWVHVLLDQHPQHLRGVHSTLENNPPQSKYGKNYFEQLNQFYFEIRYPQKNKTSFNVDELKYYSSDDMVEPNQNEYSITSLWVGYWSTDDVWEIGFQDESYSHYNDSNNSTYDIRWSTKPITNDNFEDANKILPLFYSGEDVVGIDGNNLIRRPNGWQKNVWTRFNIPNEIENKYLKIFFAVKDVSVLGAHVGKKWPYNKGDGHNAPSSNVKIIDYYLIKPNS